MNIETLHDTSLLCYIVCKVWSARKLDKKATKRLTEANQATADAARVNKYLMSSADAQLRNINAIARRARSAVEQRSLPWDDAGNRLVSNADTFPLLAELNVIETEFAKAVDEFCTAYPDLRELSLTALGDMASIEDYPDVDTVRQKFNIRSTLQPLPAGFSDTRIGLTPVQQEALKKHYEAQAAERYEDAVLCAWERLYEDVKRYTERLSLDAEGNPQRFTASMVDNLRGTMGVLSNLNIFNSPDLARLRFQIEETLCKHDPDALRDSIQIHQSAHQSATKILSQLEEMLERAQLPS